MQTIQSPALSTKSPLKTRSLLNGAASTIFDLILVALIATGLVLRFSWNNWNQDANLHPDEYGLTGTITQLAIPQSWVDYFNTRISTISPYQKYDFDGNPTNPGADNRMRWGQLPISLIRLTAEATDNTGYDEIRKLGRRMTAAADSLAVVLIFCIGWLLFNRRVGLLAAALSALAVMQIQQSHFMTADSFGVFFSALAMFAAVLAIKYPPVIRRADREAAGYTPNPAALGAYSLFGIAVGLALATKINLLPLAGMILIAALIALADLKLKKKNDLVVIIISTAIFLSFAGLMTVLIFRVAQPMSFRASSGDTTLLTLQPNQDWLDSMEVAQNESRGVGGGPPAEQWANRPAIIFPLMNMVVWGLGIPLGLAAWAGVLFALWRWLRKGQDWRSTLLPLIWVGGYFLFMGTRWVKSIRYFLPIYPFLCLFAAWALLEWLKIRHDEQRSNWLPASALSVVTIGTLIYALAFTSSIYGQDHTRVQAVRWMYGNFPAPLTLTIQTEQGPDRILVGLPDQTLIASGMSFETDFTASKTGRLQQIALARAGSADLTSDQVIGLRITIAPLDQPDLAGTQVNVSNSMQPGTAIAQFSAQPNLLGGERYRIRFELVDAQSGPVSIRRTVLANESWDEGLPFPFDGYDPFGQFYRGLSNEVRWYDDENKKDMFLQVLNESDYLIMPSQRAVWSSARIPKMYPMTMEYYRALFDGRLGFELAAHFQAPISIGPLKISDVGGVVAWNETPQLPLFNYNFFAAEEAFSVYDHPPVWVFRKKPDFNLETARQVLDQVDLKRVVIQSPRDATPDYVQ